MEKLFNLENIISILIYFLVFIVSSIIIYKGLNLFKKKKVGLLLIIAGILLPSILAGIRYNVGADFAPYLGMYNNVINGRPIYWRSIEPASTLIIAVSAFLKSSFFMFFFFSLITNVCFFFAFQNFFKNDNKKAALGFFIYLCILFSTTLNTVRSGVSLSLIALAYSYLIREWSRKSVLKSAIFLITAFLFHKSALLVLPFLPIFLIAQKESSKQTIIVVKKILWMFYLIVAILFPFIFLATNKIIPLGDYTRYLSKINTSFYSIPIANLVMSAPIFCALFYIYRKKDSVDPQFKSILYCTIFYIPLSIFVGWLTFSSNGLSRISFLLEPMIICLIVYLVSFSKNLTKFWKTISIICFILFLNAMFIRNLNWSKALPYKTIFQKESYYASEN